MGLITPKFHLKFKVSHKFHHHSFYMTFPLRVSGTVPMFALRFFLHSILFNRSILVSVQHLQSLVIASFQVFLSLPRPCCPAATLNSVMLLIQLSFLENVIQAKFFQERVRTTPVLQSHVTNPMDNCPIIAFQFQQIIDIRCPSFTGIQ